MEQNDIQEQVEEVEVVKVKNARPKKVKEPKEPKPMGRPRKTPEEKEEQRLKKLAEKALLPPVKIGRPRTRPIPEPREPKKRGPKPKADPISKAKEYYSAYYHAKLCKPTQCQMCGGLFCSRNSLLSHQAKNRICFIKRLIKNMENVEIDIPVIPETTQNYLDRNLNTTDSD